MLVCTGIIQPAKRINVWPQLDIVQQRQLSFKWADAVASAVQAGFQSAGADHQERIFQLLHVAPLAHEADAGNQSAVTSDQRIKITLQRLAGVLLKIWRVAVVTAVGAIGDGQRQADLTRYLGHRNCALYIFQRRINLLHHAGYNTRRRCDYHQQL